MSHCPSGSWQEAAETLKCDDCVVMKIDDVWAKLLKERHFRTLRDEQELEAVPSLLRRQRGNGVTEGPPEPEPWVRSWWAREEEGQKFTEIVNIVVSDIIIVISLQKNVLQTQPCSDTKENNLNQLHFFLPEKLKLCRVRNIKLWIYLKAIYLALDIWLSKDNGRWTMIIVFL